MTVAEILSLVSLISFICSAICFALVAFFWFNFDIWSIYGDLSGENAKKSIERIRQENAKSGKKTYGNSKLNEDRGKLTNGINKKRVKNQKHGKKNNIQETGVLKSEITEPLRDAIDTTTLKADDTQLLRDLTLNNNLGNDTALLSANDETNLLDIEQVNDDISNNLKSKHKIQLKMIQEVIFVSTDEVIS